MSVDSRASQGIEQLLEERVGQLEALSALSTAVARARNLEEVSAAALDCVAATLVPDRAAVLLFDARGVMRFRAWRGLSDDYRRATEGHSPWSPDTRDPRPVLVEDLRAEPSLAELRATIEVEGIRSLGFFPLMDRERLLGKFVVYYDAPHRFTPIEVRFAQAIGAHVALEIARGQREARTGFLVEASHVLGRSLDSGTTLGRLAELSVPFLAELCEIHVAEEAGLRRVASATPGSSEPAMRTDEGAEAARDVVESGEPRLYERETPSGVRSVMVVPMHARGRTFGAMTFVAAGGGRHYDEADIDFACELAGRAALAVDNAFLHEDEQRARGTTERLQGLTEALAQVLTTPEVAALVVSEGTAALGAAGGWVAELDEEARELRRLAAVGHRAELADAYSRLPLEASDPTVDVTLGNRPLWFASGAEVAAAYPALADDYAKTGFEAMAVVPIGLAGHATGAIALNFTRPRTFRDDERRLLLGLAAQCGQALERARLYGELQERADAASVLAHVGDGVFQLDLDERVTLWNRGAEYITDIDEADALGRPIGDLLGDWEELRDRIAITDTPIAVGRREALPVSIEGRELWLVISGVTSGDGVVYAFRDVTESEQLERARRDFLATVSHELRTPLAGVFGATKTLLHRELDETTRRAMLQVIDSQSERLAQILDELLSAARLDAGKVDLATESCDVVPLVEEAVALQRARAPEEIELVFDPPADLPQVRCDPAKLRQVVLNVLDNAVKYSPEGGTITVSLAASDGTVRLSVADEGLGIPASARERVFEKFVRLDPQLSRGVGGTGLGLYLSREFVTHMDGRIWIEPAESQGTIFHMELPDAGTAEPSAPSA